MSDAPERIWAWPADAAGQWSKQLTGGFGTSKPSKKSTEYRRADLPPTREQIMADPRVMALVEWANEAVFWVNSPDLWHDDLKSALAALEAPASLPRTDNEGETE